MLLVQSKSLLEMAVFEQSEGLNIRLSERDPPKAHHSLKRHLLTYSALILAQGFGVCELQEPPISTKTNIKSSHPKCTAKSRVWGAETPEPIAAKKKFPCSGAGTNLKVGAPVRRKSGGGHRSGAKHRKKIVLVVPLQFLALKVQLFVLVSAFVMASTVWSVSRLLSFYSRCSLCPAICKSWGGAPVPYGVGATVSTHVTHPKWGQFDT